jgi:hypothetical protein
MSPSKNFTNSTNLRSCIQCGIPLVIGSDLRAKYCDKACQRTAQMQRSSKKKLDAYAVAGTVLIYCKICGFPGKDLAGHIGKLHMPVAEYRKQFSCGSEAIRVPEYLKGQSERYRGEKNPGFNHGGLLSVFSKNNPKYSDEAKRTAIEKSSISCKTNGNHSSTLQYWLNRGFDEQTAIEKQSERQSTFSLDLCIQKHGETEGRKIWQERQTKWLKSYPFSNYSQISQKLFWQIYNVIGEKFGPVMFAELNRQTMTKESKGKNHEIVLELNGKSIKPDFLVVDRNAVIEFDGDYWHERDMIMDDKTNKTRSETRDLALTAAGYRVLHIKEREFNANLQSTIDKCINFITCNLKN